MTDQFSHERSTITKFKTTFALQLPSNNFQTSVVDLNLM